MNRELDVILVSSGAMGFGLDILKMDKRPAEVARQQAVSSVGQSSYDEPLFSNLFALSNQCFSDSFNKEMLLNFLKVLKM